MVISLGGDRNEGGYETGVQYTADFPTDCLCMWETLCDFSRVHGHHGGYMFSMSCHKHFRRIY